MSYGKVHDVFWDDEKIEALSDRAALLSLFLITGPHRNAIGCFKLGIGAITDNPRFGGWGIEGVSKALRELVDIGFIVRDDRTGWTFIRNALKHDPINGSKAAIHALSLVARVPTNTPVYQALRERLEPQLAAHDEHLIGKSGWPLPYPNEGVSEGHAIPNRSPSPLPEPLPEPSPEPQPRAPAREVSPPADDSLDQAFETWWAKYPRYRRGAKGPARKKWMGVIRRGAATAEQLLAGLDRYLAAGYGDSQFACGAEVWLNGERWTIEQFPPPGDVAGNGVARGKVSATSAEAARLVEEMGAREP